MPADDDDLYEHDGEPYVTEVYGGRVGEAGSGAPGGGAAAAPADPSGLGGWMILPIIGLFVTLLMSIASLVTTYIPMFRSGAWSAATDQGSLTYHPWMAPIAVFELFTCVVTIVGPLVLLVLLFQKKHRLPKLLIAFYVFVLFAAIVDAVALVTFGADVVRRAGYIDLAGTMASETTAELVRTVVASAIWIPYFLVSKRVRNTFTVGAPAPETMRETRRGTLWVAGVLLAAALVCVGFLAWKSTTLTDEARALVQTPSGVKVYTDADHGYTFEYPPDWVLQDLSGTAQAAGASSYVSVFDPNGATSGLYALDNIGVAVYELSCVFQEADIADLELTLESLYSEMTWPGADALIIEPLTPVVLAGLKGYKISYTSTAEGVSLTTTEYTLIGADLEYDLLLQAESQDWTLCRGTFDAFVKSFKIPAE